jgi:hypothetical protein
MQARRFCLQDIRLQMLLEYLSAVTMLSVRERYTFQDEVDVKSCIVC